MILSLSTEGFPAESHLRPVYLCKRGGPRGLAPHGGARQVSGPLSCNSCGRIFGKALTAGRRRSGIPKKSNTKAAEENPQEKTNKGHKWPSSSNVRVLHGARDLDTLFHAEGQ